MATELTGMAALFGRTAKPTEPQIPDAPPPAFDGVLEWKVVPYSQLTPPDDWPHLVITPENIGAWRQLVDGNLNQQNQWMRNINCWLWAQGHAILDWSQSPPVAYAYQPAYVQYEPTKPTPTFFPPWLEAATPKEGANANA